MPKIPEEVAAETAPYPQFADTQAGLRSTSTIPEVVAAATLEACAAELELYAVESRALSPIERQLIRTVAQALLRDNRTTIIASVTKPGEG